MPRRVWAPHFALGMSVDLGALAGVALLNRGGASVSVSQRYHQDPISFATGRCSPSGRSLGEELDDAGYSLALRRDDLLAITGAEEFEIQAAATNAQLGFDPAGQASVPDGLGQHVIVAARDWKLGPCDARLTIIDGGGAFVVPGAFYRANSVIDLLRRADLDDDDVDDSVVGSLQARDNAVYDEAFKRIRYGWTLDGRLFSAWPAALDLPAPTITSAAFRTLVGVDGTEQRQTIGSLHVWEAARPARWLLCPSSPAARIVAGHIVQVAGGQTRGGVTVLNEQMRVLTRRIEWYVDGPGAVTPLHDHTDWWLRNARDFVLYHAWGEPRRAIPTAECDAVEGTTRAPYDLVYTSEANGERGRIRLSRPKDAGFTREFEFTGSHRRRVEQKITGHVVWETTARWPSQEAG